MAKGFIWANISTSTTGLLQGQSNNEKSNSEKFFSLLLWPWRRLVVLVEILAQIKPFAVVSALQSVCFIYT